MATTCSLDLRDETTKLSDLCTNRADFGLVGIPPCSEEKAKAWSSLLKVSPHFAGKEVLYYIPPNVGDCIAINDDLLEEGAKDWEDCVVGFFLDKKLPYTLVQTMVKKRWKLQGELEIGLDGDMYYFKFNNAQDREDALDGGSFFMAGKLFVVKAWSIEVEENRGLVMNVPVWVKFLNVPKHLWNTKGLSVMASALGKPLCMDKTTEDRKMLTFARICVEISAENELPNEIKLKTSKGNTLTIPLEYTWKPDICTHCKMFGHKSTNCLIKFPNQGKVNENEVRVQRNQEFSKISEGQWKKVAGKSNNNLEHCHMGNAHKKVEQIVQQDSSKSKAIPNHFVPPQTTSSKTVIVTSNSFSCLEAA
ncbi:Rna exonuclease [Thalictrum thalictroides]|uniref:Rna exonuclease n=1 Tax=Thalictrum thalictroides TaxID=46969 RepID=A0A7J6X8K1_THATH|nr:Rna exonuclease [Thalictrum thalictroides]